MDKTKIKLVGFVALALFVLVFMLSLFTSVPNGTRAVVTVGGQIQGKVLDPGFHWVAPWESVHAVNVQFQKYDDKTEAFSKENQSIYTDLTATYHINPATLEYYYSRIGVSGESKFLDAQIRDTVKAVTSKYNVDEVIQNREKIRSEVKTDLTAKMLALTNSAIIIDDVSFTNFSFSPAYHQAILNKQIAEQNALQAQQVLKQREYEGQQLVVMAKAKADSQAVINNSTNDKSLAYLKLENERLMYQRWNGQLPSTVLGSGGNLFNIPVTK